MPHVLHAFHAIHPDATTGTTGTTGTTAAHELTDLDWSWLLGGFRLCSFSMVLSRSSMLGVPPWWPYRTWISDECQRCYAWSSPQRLSFVGFWQQVVHRLEIAWGSTAGANFLWHFCISFFWGGGIFSRFRSKFKLKSEFKFKLKSKIKSKFKFKLKSKLKSKSRFKFKLSKIAF